MICQPQYINDDNWCYLEDNLVLIHHVRDKQGKYIQYDSIKIPWKFIRQQLSRHDHKKVKK